MSERIYILFGLTFFIVFVLTGIYDVTSNYFTTKGTELYDTQKQVEYYQMQNILLREKIASYSSLFTIAKEAKEQGYIPATYLYLKQ